MADNNSWYPEGGFYEQQAGQGEDQWADYAQFDIITAPVEDVPPTASSVSLSELIAPASYTFKSYNS